METARTAGAAVPKRLKTAAAADAAAAAATIWFWGAHIQPGDRERGGGMGEIVRRNCLIMYQRQINLRNLNAVFRLSGSTSHNDDYDNELIFAWSTHTRTYTHTRTHTHRVYVQFLWMEYTMCGMGRRTGTATGTDQKHMISVECTISTSLYL